MKTTLKKLSIYPCGFPTLNEEIKLGTEFDVEPGRRDIMTFMCGGCKKWHRIVAIWVYRRGESHAGYLPIEIFDLGALHLMEPTTTNNNNDKQKNQGQ
jgi:hypothetical protein